MKFTLSMKSPDALHYLREDLEGRDPEDIEEAVAFASEYLTYGEYLHVEFDTETREVRVRKA